MGILAKLGKAALNALESTARYADEARERKAAAQATTEAASKPEAEAQAEPEAQPEAKAQAELASAEPELGDSKIPVQVFGRMSCGWTQRVLRLLTDRNIEHVYTELAAPGGFAYAPRLKAATGQRTVPYVYVRGQFIGGYNALDEIDRLGQLDELLESDEERAASGGNSRTRIQVARRTD